LFHNTPVSWPNWRRRQLAIVTGDSVLGSLTAMHLFDPGIRSESSMRALCYNLRRHNYPYLHMGKQRTAMASYSRPMSVENDGEEQWHMKIDIDDESQPVEELPG
jgi:hypothetical protein